MKPMHGAYLFKALKDKGCIIMACNTRICVGIMKGLFRAAKEADAAFIIELAKSECNADGGYTGLTPKTLSEHACKTASEVEFEVWGLHADHTAVKKGSEEELEDEALYKLMEEADQTETVSRESIMKKLKS